MVFDEDIIEKLDKAFEDWKEHKDKKIENITPIREKKKEPKIIPPKELLCDTCYIEGGVQRGSNCSLYKKKEVTKKKKEEEYISW